MASRCWAVGCDGRGHVARLGLCPTCYGRTCQAVGGVQGCAAPGSTGGKRAGRCLVHAPATKRPRKPRPLRPVRRAVVVEGPGAARLIEHAGEQGWAVESVQGLGDAVRRADQGSADVLLVVGPADLGADVLPALEAMERAEQLGWRIATPAGLDTSTPGGWLAFTVLLGAAAHGVGQDVADHVQALASTAQGEFIGHVLDAVATFQRRQQAGHHHAG